MIIINESKTADTRTCDYSKVDKLDLLLSSTQHICDVWKGIDFFKKMLTDSAKNHDTDKITGIDQFYDDFITGFKQTTWWDNHRKITRHHMLEDDGVPPNVNLIDILEMISDCVMAGMGRCGEVYPLVIKPEVLMQAFENTVELLKSEVVVAKENNEYNREIK